jgi:ribonucleoside-triphosphate reductase
MQQRITEMYDRELAAQYIDDLEKHRIYRHDETAVVGKPYCASVTMYPFLLHGITGLGGTSTAPTN